MKSIQNFTLPSSSNGRTYKSMKRPQPNAHGAAIFAAMAMLWIGSTGLSFAQTVTTVAGGYRPQIGACCSLRIITTLGAQNLHVTERIRRADEDTILYQFTVEDPGMWTKPWSGEVPIKKISGQLYEYACHEANYGLENTLRGARVAEAEAAKKAAK
jgi:hypothetical protein